MRAGKHHRAFRLVWPVLTAVLVVLCIVLLWWQRQRTGMYAVVQVDGVETARLSLAQDTEYPIATPYGNNVVVVSGHTVRVREADCPDNTCVRQGAAHYVGECIVCLPHRVVVTVQGEESSPVDAEG